jgi:hypothetical protein
VIRCILLGVDWYQWQRAIQESKAIASRLNVNYEEKELQVMELFTRKQVIFSSVHILRNPVKPQRLKNLGVEQVKDKYIGDEVNSPPAPPPKGRVIGWYDVQKPKKKHSKMNSERQFSQVKPLG